jgi:hypothetical protein
MQITGDVIALLAALCFFFALLGAVADFFEKKGN